MFLLQCASPEVSATYREIARTLSIVESPRHFASHGLRFTWSLNRWFVQARLDLRENRSEAAAQSIDRGIAIETF